MTSMSYCMIENTTQEMNQLLGAMEEAETMEELDLNSYEQEAFSQLVLQCQEFLALAEKLGGTAEEDDAKYGYIDADDLV